MKQLLLILLIASPFIKGEAQLRHDVVASSGASLDYNDTQLDFTLGEVVISSVENEEILITQGFHQPNFIISDKDSPKEICSVEVYPNPAAKTFTVDLKYKENKHSSIHFYNSAGQLIWSEFAKSSFYKFEKNIENLPKGNYFLNLLIDNKLCSKSFKIQKL